MGIPPFLPLGERRSFFFDILLRALQMCRTAPGGAKTGIAAFQAARMTSAFRRAARVPFRTDEKEPKVRLRGLHRPLRDPLEYLAMTRRLPSLPTGTPAVGTIQVAGAPNREERRVRLHQPSIRGWLDVSGGGILKGGELCAPIFFKRAPLERPSSADFLGAQEVGPPAGAGPGNPRRQRRHIWSAPEGREKSLPSPGRKT